MADYAGANYAVNSNEIGVIYGKQGAMEPGGVEGAK